MYIYTHTHTQTHTQLKDKDVKSVLQKVRNRKDIRHIIFWLTTHSLGDSIYYQKCTKGSIMYQVDLLYLILDVTLKICQLSSNNIF